MRHSALRNVHLAAAFFATFLLASCGDGTSEANEATAAEADSNVMLEELGNDASALEAASNADPIQSTEDAPDDPDSSDAALPGSGNSSQPVFGESTGGDTGGNTVQGNVSGM